MIDGRCDECGFETWTDEAALEKLADLPDLWAAAINGLSAPDLLRRSRFDRLSIAAYADDVRETVFGMRFVLDVALAKPGSDLGASATPRSRCSHGKST